MEWELAKQARIDFADVVDGLNEEQQMAGTTLCNGWSPHLLTAHLLTFIEVPLPKFMFGIAKHKGKFDPAAVVFADNVAEGRTTSQLTAALRSGAGKKSALPIFPAELTTIDAFVHRQDVRRGLGLGGDTNPDVVRTALEFLTTSKKAKPLLEQKGVLDDLRFEATDLDWAHGDGDLVSGPGEALVMAMLRRDVDAELTGDGVAVLAARTRG